MGPTVSWNAGDKAGELGVSELATSQSTGNRSPLAPGGLLTYLCRRRLQEVHLCLESVVQVSSDSFLTSATRAEEHPLCTCWCAARVTGNKEPHLQAVQSQVMGCRGDRVFPPGRGSVRGGLLLSAPCRGYKGCLESLPSTWEELLSLFPAMPWVRCGVSSC